MTIDNRLHARYRVALAAELTLGARTLSAATQNLSAGGVGVMVSEALVEGTTIGVCIFLTQDGVEDPDQEPFDGRATVAWCAPTDAGTHLAGLRFAGVDEPQRLQLQAFLSALEA